MTTIVKVKAHCNSEKFQVKVTVVETIDVVGEHILQNGEEIELFVYEDRIISVREVPKL